MMTLEDGQGTRGPVAAEDLQDRKRVAAAYRAILNREPDEGGMQVHLAALEQDPTGESVIRSLLGSPEFRSAFPERQLGIYRCFDFEVLMSTDDWMFDDIRSHGVYEPYVVEAYREACVDRRVLDIGANIGVFSMVAARVSTKKVTAVEVSPANAKLVIANAHMNGLANIEVLPVAASDAFGLARFATVDEFDKVVRDHAITAENIHLIDVALSAPLDALVTDRIDVIKIDIEGREYAALRGAANILTAKPAVFLEFSPNFMLDGCGVSPETFLDLFYSNGYRATVLHRDMTREPIGQDSAKLMDIWSAYMSRSITHVDMMMIAP